MRGAHELKSCTAQWACFNSLTSAAHSCSCETLTYPHPPGWNPLSSAQNQARNKCIMSSPGAPKVQRNPVYSVLIFKWHFIPVIFRCSLIVVYCYSSDFSYAVPSQIIEFWLSDYELPSKVAIIAFNIVQSITAALWLCQVLTLWPRIKHNPFSICLFMRKAWRCPCQAFLALCCVILESDFRNLVLYNTDGHNVIREVLTKLIWNMWNEILIRSACNSRLFFHFSWGSWAISAFHIVWLFYSFPLY